MNRKTSQRLEPSDSKDFILYEALKMSLKHGYQNLTRLNVARAAGVSPSLISHYFHNMKKLQDAVVAFAITNKIHKVIAQAIVHNHPLCEKLTPYVRKKALSMWGRV